MNDDYSLVRLFDTSAEFLIAHFAKLSPEDNRLRFGTILKEPRIEKYIRDSFVTEGTRTKDNLWFAIKCDGEIVATLHVAIVGDSAEFGFTTLETHRGKKLGQLLFARGYQVVTERSIHKIYMVCLSENRAMRHIAYKFGMKMFSEQGDNEGTLEIEYPASINHLNRVRQTIIDGTLR